MPDALVRQPGTVLAFDFGVKRIGVAVGEWPLAQAHPLTTIHGEANAVRFALLGLALAWSLRFEWRLTGLRSAAPLRRLSAVGLIALGLVPFCWAWELFFVRW